MIRILTLLVLVLIWSGSACTQPLPDSRGAVAYSIGGTLTIKSASGRTLQTFKTTPPIGTFTISPDGQNVIFTPLGRDSMQNGGPLYLLSVSTGKVTRLIHANVYDEHEVYAYPDFSPSGDQLVFAIHVQQQGDANDLVMSAGPFAVLDLRSGMIMKLSSVIDKKYGQQYGTSPRWSPNGKQIFLNIEDDFALIDSSGNHLQDTSGWTLDNTLALNWLGNACIVYIAGENWKDAEEHPAKVLNLKTHQTESLDKVLAVAQQEVTNLIAISPTMRIRKAGDRLIVQIKGGSWSIQDAELHPNIRILSAGMDVHIPEFCR